MADTDPAHDSPQDFRTSVQSAGVNPGYAAWQIAKALTASEQHQDPAVRDRAKQKITLWATVLRNILSGTVDYGSRAPVEGVPVWATLEVATGGFATGELLASGPLQAHETKLLNRLERVQEGQERQALNAWFLTDSGLADLQGRLRTGCYDVEVPEEAALMVVAWLAEHGHADKARDLIDTLVPFFTKLRFYPVLLDEPRRFSARVHVRNVGKTIEDIRSIRPNTHVLAQKEAVEIWAPFYDRMVALFLETIENDWPCRSFPNGWRERAEALLGEYARLREHHKICGKPERHKGHFAQLRELLARAAASPSSLTGRDVGRIRLILRRYVEKHGAPDSAQCAEARRRQRRDVAAPTFHAIAQAILPRLDSYPRNEGLDDVSHLTAAITTSEAAVSGLPEGTPVPDSIARKVARCLNEAVAELIERGLITSGESLARVLPQMTSDIRAAGISDPHLRRLYAAAYRAFRRRRSLLLLNLQSQIKIEELPWIAAIDRFGSDDLPGRTLAYQTLQELSLLTITSFPYAILPNKLLQELHALIKGAELTTPIVEEVAADIFMGRFSPKFPDAAMKAADLLDRSLYAKYYGIDYAEVRRLFGGNAEPPKKRFWFWQKAPAEPPLQGFAQYCAARAGVAIGTWDPAINGMIIEQQQILTTQNLAALFADLDLADTLRDRLADLARECFLWICKRHQVKLDRWHAGLIMLKNTAYAWRQMVFFLALLPDRNVAEFLKWSEQHLDQQSEAYRNRFLPVLKGLALAAHGGSLDSDTARESGGIL